MSAAAARDNRLLEVSVALEIVRHERDHLRSQLDQLQKQLDQAVSRAERSEARLHEVTMTMAELSRQAILAPGRSNATEIMVDGKSVLRLSNPIPGGR
jgi:chromosome segregation ATPase